QTAERDAALFAAGEDAAERVAGRTAQRVHGHLQFGVEVPGAGGVELVLHLALALHELVHVGVGIAEGVVDLVEFFEEVDDRLHALLDDLANALRRIELRLLFEKANRVAGREHRLADEIAVGAGQDAQQRRLARSVQTDDADLRAIKIGEVDVLEDLLLAVELRYSDHRVDDLVWF